jgi:hypothetical protein
MRSQTRARSGLKENSLSNGTLLWWNTALLDGMLSVVCHGLGVFSSGARRKMWGDGGVCEWICTASQGAILLTERAHWEWWLVGVRYWNTKRQGFLPECKGFSLNSVYGSRIEDFLRIFVPRGSCFRVFGSSKVPEFVWKQWNSHLQAERGHHNASTEIEILYLLPKTKHP